MIATDDVGGVHYQRTKLDVGGDGAASPLVRGQQTAANSLPVVLASDGLLAPATASTTALVNASMSAFTVLAANAARKGATIAGNGVATTYVLMGSGTPSSTNWTFKLAADDVVQLGPGEYTGIIKALSVAATGSLLVTEYT